MTLTHRDISWLSFNYRVLQEAADSRNPLFERIKFLAIYSSNLDEFFRVRVASIRSILRAGKKPRKEIDFDPVAVHNEIMKTVNEQQIEFGKIFFHHLIPELNKQGINLLRPRELNDRQKIFLKDLFEKEIARYVQPVMLNKQKIRPFLVNGALYLAVTLKNKHDEKYALIQVPVIKTGRFVTFQDEKERNVIMIDDVMRFVLPSLFPGYEVKACHSFKLTRDAELNIDDEYSGNLIEKIQMGLAKRNAGPATRFIYDRDMPPKKLKLLCSIFDISEQDLIPEGRYHNNSDLMKFPDFGMDELKEQPLPPLEHPFLKNQTSIFKAIEKQTSLLHFPYQSYEYVLNFFEQAADDPKVTHIRLTLYRAAKRSRIMNALIKAIQNGKKVTIFIEVKARFDEENNLLWAEQLEEAGANILYSMPGLKVHSKVALVSRLSGGKKEKHYAFFSTGNFNENTAKIYTDYGYFTDNRELTDEAYRLFTFLETQEEPELPFKHLWVGRFNLYEEIVKHIDKEIRHAREGRAAEIFVKINSLEEGSIIEKLCEAARAGVKVKMIVRGICCLSAGTKGLENLEIISVVDRFLEHARVYCFQNGGDEVIQLSSADFMYRNLHGRVEVAFPIVEPDLRQEIKDCLHLQWNDNVKARLIDMQKNNQYKPIVGDEAPLRSQIEIYNYYKNEAATSPSDSHK